MSSLSRTKSAATSAVEILIIGGGPAGSTAGAWLGRQDRRVLLCEREAFPRFHIGESLLPSGNRILHEIGVLEKIENAGFIEKYGAEFCLPDRSNRVHNVFANGIVKGLEKAYQVERSRFDKILLDHAEESGCVVRQRTVVSKTERTDKGWTVCTKNLDTGEEQDIQANWIIDASGRACVMGKTLGLKKETIPYPGRFAVFNHFTGFPRDPGKEGGNIIVLRQKDAWFWVIPVSETTTSVGVVAQKGARSDTKESLEDFFWRKVAQSSYLSESLSEAEKLGEFRVESDYCFSYDKFGSEQTLLAGDAASFIDPVFSSGVYLALESGLSSAKTIEAQLKRNSGYIDDRVYDTYTKSIKDRVGVMRRLIESYYDNKSYEVFSFPSPRLKLPAAINSVLAGCTRPPLAVRWRFWVFEKICAMHKRWSIVPAVRWRLVSKKQKTEVSDRDSLRAEVAETR